MGSFALIKVLLLAFLICFIFRESLSAIRKVGLKGLLLGDQWRPLIYKDAPSYGIRNMILSILYVSVLAVVFAVVIGVGCALFLACLATERQRTIVMSYIDLLASIPSVIYGFISLYIVVKFFEKLGQIHYAEGHQPDAGTGSRCDPQGQHPSERQRYPHHLCGGTAPSGGYGIPDPHPLPHVHLQKHDLRASILRRKGQTGPGCHRPGKSGSYRPVGGSKG